jgi:UDP-glucose 4-epimerase
MVSNKYVIGITGGSGYIGFSLAEYLANSFDIRLFDIRPPQKKEIDNMKFLFCDIRNEDQLRRSLEDVDFVIHTAIVQIPAINEQKKLGYEVNFLGTQNVCKIVDENPRIKGLILAGSWHTVGERELRGIINEEFGFRPDKVEDRARLYALAKIAQECVVRFYDEMSEKVFGIIRMGTVLGEGMPEKTAANIFIQNGIEGKALTPFMNSMFRPMLYVDISDVCRAFESFTRKVLNGEIEKKSNSLVHIFNVYYPAPVTVLELAEIVRDAIVKYSNGKTKPKIELVDTGQPSLFSKGDKELMNIDINKALNVLGLKELMTPRESINEIVRSRLLVS